jgi:hypothetical protein
MIHQNGEPASYYQNKEKEVDPMAEIQPHWKSYRISRCLEGIAKVRSAGNPINRYCNQAAPIGTNMNEGEN